MRSIEQIEINYFVIKFVNATISVADFFINSINERIIAANTRSDIINLFSSLILRSSKYLYENVHTRNIFLYKKFKKHVRKFTCVMCICKFI